MDFVIPYLCNFFCFSLHYPRRQVWRITGTTVRRGSPFQNTWTLGIWVVGLLLWTSWWTWRTDRHGLRRPILEQFLLLLSSFPSKASMTDRHRHNGPSRVFVSKYFNSWNRVLDHFSELYDEPAGRTVIATTDSHKLRNPTLGQTSPCSFGSCTTLPPTDRHKHDGPS